MAGQTGNKNKKYGRNTKKAHNTLYKAMNLRKRNKMRKLKSHITRFPEDLQAIASLTKIDRGEVGVKPKQKWFKKYKPNREKGLPDMMYRTTTR